MFQATLSVRSVLKQTNKRIKGKRGGSLAYLTPPTLAS